MKEVTGDIHLSNILGYLGSTLPRLDAEVGNTSSLNGIGDLPSILRVNGKYWTHVVDAFCD